MVNFKWKIILQSLFYTPEIAGNGHPSQVASVVIQTPMCRTTTFQSSFFNRIVKPWNRVRKDVDPDTFSTPDYFYNLS
jgi:hypothetical protein